MRNVELEKRIWDHIDNLTKPIGSLGELERIAAKIAFIHGSVKPRYLERKRVYVFAGDHGVVEEGVSAYPKEVTREMVYNFLRGGAAINVFARHVGAEVFVVDAGVDAEFEPHPKLIIRKVGKGTRNFTKGPAMTPEQAELSLEYGRQIASVCLKERVDIAVVGDMGIGNTTTATAIAVAMGIPMEDVLDIGTVIDPAGLEKKRSAVLRAIELNKPDPNDPTDILTKVGSYCFGEMAGFILGMTRGGKPVVIDGFPTTAAACIAHMIDPDLSDYLFAGHRSAVKGHAVLLERLQLRPILDLDMRLGEGTGGVLALSIIDAAVKMANEMATFQSAGVSKGNEIPEER
ncbi:TPA: nicotinate-nucleotide--dimethylbenzimidazole phosphoribosyltransferase [Candidatus Poribacteria bacterium]|nr:nicotinate-nucleotide--dimethylbenzimidazole phosphoribosyltransferase [Candidatus Poribacteria bacterium]HEX29772.1 nicotinate-nucleotide--dimethylbenzimidazole phosphoribosyltransferase [Candidatus Poribacteria bacterium]